MRVIFHCLVRLEFLWFEIKWRNLALTNWFWLFLRRYLFGSCYFSYVFFNIFSDFKLKLKLSYKKLDYSVLLYLSGHLMGAIDSYTADDSQQIYHEDCINGWHSTHMRWFLGRWLNLALKTEQFCHCERGIQLDEVEECKFEIETGDLLLQHRLCQLVLAIIEYILDELQQLVK